MTLVSALGGERNEYSIILLHTVLILMLSSRIFFVVKESICESFETSGPFIFVKMVV